ncbi:protein phosphatase 1 regulatory subunit 12A-like isoform X1 [Anneissia japonica]|uniref:protein phosphatase 1 regulatory subunit 12A-like isoform X1 n=1 Tax=Anneissia japonica TaxID=1529436 RepID=UPI0014258B0E|nr:protein phosphatase 1 regulatory subunit 12A-like isoform X1 [Anneissia japonica]
MVGNEGVAKMADGGSQKSALIRRHEQLERWKGSELDKEPAINPKKTTRVKFDKGCVFLASCASGDEKEVKAMLDSGTDINYANIDGLTAIHQAVIDEKLDMVEFLIENGANLEAKDNEGWTALHASSSCGFLDITKYLVENGANLSAVNSEGEIPLDLAEDDEMEEYLQEEIDRQGLDVEAARKEEERKIIDDANQWLNSKSVKDKPHPKTGATALHVASAKGYIKALSLLLQAGMDINSQDNDGWTPFHAASHWGQKESAELLVEKMCDMNARNKLGQTAFDLGDDQMVKYLEELKKKQASMKPDSKSSTPRIESRQPPPQLRRRSSVSRMSVQERNQTLHQDMQREREALKEKMHGQEKEQKKKTYESSSSSASESESSEDEENVTNKENTKKIGASSTRVSMTKEVPGFTPKPLKKQESRDEVPPWRQGLRKTGSSSAVPETKRNDEIADRVQRSASSPRIAGEDRKDKDESRAVSNRLSGGGGRAISGSQSTSAILDRSKTNEEGSVRDYDIYNRPGMYRRRYPDYSNTDQDQDRYKYRSSAVPTNSPIIESKNALPPTTTTTAPLTTASTTITTSPRSPRRTYMIPAKEDESETTRRARARRERSSRRSTQGVTAEDLEGAEKYVGQCNSTDSQKKEIDNKEMQKEIELPRRRHGVYTKVQTESQDSKDEEETKVETKPPERSGTARSASTSSISRYGDTSSVLDRSSRNSLRDTTYSSSRDRVTSVPCQNCKKLFEEQQSQVEKLEEKLKNKEKEIANQKVQLERAQSKSEHIETKSYDHEKREKRALERKLSELEEEIKTIHQLKQDNQRLKDENGALVRVISKLSK